MRIAVDVMGGDHGPEPLAAAALRFSFLHPSVELLIIGDTQQLSANTRSALSAQNNVSLLCHKTFISQEQTVSSLLRRKNQSSLQIGLDQLQIKQCSALVSPANTGALVVCCKKSIGFIHQLRRPALIGQIPHSVNEHSCFMMDCGASLTADVKRLKELFFLGKAFYLAYSDALPKIGLLNVGEEVMKGDRHIKAFTLWQQKLEDECYSGNVEGKALFSSLNNIVLTNGFAGNLVLKSLEGLGALVVNILSQFEQGGSNSANLAQISRKLDKDQYNGALLAGVNGLVIKSHGGAGENAFFASLEKARLYYDKDIVTRLSAHWYQTI